MELQISVDRDTKGQNVRRNKVIFCDTKVSELSVGHHLSIAGALSAAKPPDDGIPGVCFPSGNHQSCSGMIPYGNISALARFPSVSLCSTDG